MWVLTEDISGKFDSESNQFKTGISSSSLSDMAMSLNLFNLNYGQNITMFFNYIYFD